MTYKIIILKIIILLIFSEIVKSQINAEFTSNVTSGCSPLTVNFTNQSTGNYTTLLWTFGNGNTADIQTPSILYVNPGTYTVTLIASNSSTKDTVVKTNYITVYSNPIALFSATPLMGCKPLNVSFTDSSAQGSGVINQWSWVFGDGTIDNNQNPTHIYNNNINYTVTLNITDQNGCTDSEQKSNYISVSAPPIINISASPVFSCDTPLFVTFTNTSSGAAPLTYAWNLGDGTNSIALNPTHTYASIGNYDIYLTVTDSKGCSKDTILNNFINVSNVIADFSMVNDTLCKSISYAFTNTSIGGTTYSWNFGDGTALSTLQSPSHTFIANGLYTVTLISTENANCKDTVQKNVLVESVTASLLQSATTFCNTPFVVNFTDNTAGNNVAWQWNFGNGTTSIDQNPSGTYTNFGTFIPSLQVTNNHGCKGTVNGTPIIIAKPTVTITYDTTRGCVPVTVNFTGESNSVQQVTTWNWDFGDGGTSNIQNPTYTYNTAGDFTITLSIENSDGCTNVTDTIIEFGYKLDPIISIDNDTTCAKDVVKFDDLTVPLDIADEWYWSFGEGEGTSTQQNATHTYQDTTGVFYINYVVTYNGCDSDTLKDSVLVYGPIVEIEASMDCDYPFEYTFDIHVVDGQRYVLDFGDGTDSTLNFIDTCSLFQSIVHNYDVSLQSTNPIITFTAYNDTVNNSDGCDNDASVTIYLRDVEAHFAMSDSFPCTYESVKFDALNPNTDSLSIDGSVYEWFKINSLGVITAIGTGSMIHHTFGVDGFYTVKLKVTDVNGCKDSIEQSISTVQILTGFKTDNSIGCTPFNVQFIDTTISDEAIVDWNWNIGGGVLLENNDTVYNTFNNIQTYNVSLTVTDFLGCVGTITKPIISTKPKPTFTIADYTLCDGDSVKFTYTSSYSVAGPYTYLWNFDDGTSDTIASPYHTFAYPADTFIVSLYMVDNLGCDSLLADTLQLITVQPYPIAGFTVDTTVWDCYKPGHRFDFTDTTISDYLNYWYWTLNDTISYTINYDVQNPQHIFPLTGPGKYDVSLIVSTTNGCRDTISKPQYITVKGPLATMIVPPVVCRGEEVIMSVTDTSFVYSFEWFFGDGFIDSTLNDSTSHIYNMNFNDSVSINLRTGPNDNCVITKKMPIYVHDLKAIFSGGDINTCTSDPVVFTDASTNTSGSVNKWIWYYGDGNTDTTQGPQTHLYSPGTYTVQLFVNNQFGCLDSLIKTFTVNSLPIATASNDTTICVGESVTLNATGGVSYVWSPSTYLLNNSNLQNPTSKPDSLIYYVVTVTDVNNCSNTADVLIKVQHPISMDLFTIYNGNQSSNDTVFIIMGDTVNFNAVTDSTGLFLWTPSDGLNCSTCPNPYANPIQSIGYSVMVYDTNQCNFETVRNVYIDVSEATIDVPTAFTPNGDNNGNDTIFVKGWGIKTLLEFKIFNRWGQVVFETTDLKKGWDGKYLGANQNVDTYVFIVRAEAYNGEVLYKKGYINLIR